MVLYTYYMVFFEDCWPLLEFILAIVFEGFMISMISIMILPGQRPSNFR